MNYGFVVVHITEVRMKTVKFQDSETGQIKCPECGKVLLDLSNADSVQYCKHVKLWYNSVLGEFVRVAPGFKKLTELLSEDNSSFRALDKCLTDDYYVAHFDSGYIGGCQEAHDWLVFKRK